MRTTKLVSIVGARPQFIKLAALAKKMSCCPFSRQLSHIIIHTGQHYDYEMSKIFFQELNLPKPDYHLGIGSHSPSKQIGKMMEAIEHVLEKEKPDIVMVYGDTNTTLAGAISAVHSGIPVVHIEAGLRSFKMDMPEEINRIITDRISTLLFCPTKDAVRNLKKEGKIKNVYFVGDVMYDVFLKSQNYLWNRHILDDLGLTPKNYLLLTIHRRENLLKINNVINILENLNRLKEKTIFPIHPGTKKTLEQNGCDIAKFTNIVMIKPIGYLDMLYLEKNARKIITDSGGVQKEAFWNRIPCVVLRSETEWKELLKYGYLNLVGNDSKKLLDAINKPVRRKKFRSIFGNGNASGRILHIINHWAKINRATSL
ncbi:MAG: UDP-N-acetylglucosamine 2-epimerase (non-hydrolyzing) [bacterium]|nr:UDP-N-acetylglucosamine 2-epimerase (non-hydrolyzing) [bacterium]